MTKTRLNCHSFDVQASFQGRHAQQLSFKDLARLNLDASGAMWMPGCYWAFESRECIVMKLAKHGALFIEACLVMEAKCRPQD